MTVFVRTNIELTDLMPGSITDDCYTTDYFLNYFFPADEKTNKLDSKLNLLYFKEAAYKTAPKRKLVGVDVNIFPLTVWMGLNLSQQD